LNFLIFWDRGEGFWLTWGFTKRKMGKKEKMEKEIIEKELSQLMEITLKMENELDMIEE